MYANDIPFQRASNLFNNFELFILNKNCVKMFEINYSVLILIKAIYETNTNTH